MLGGWDCGAGDGAGLEPVMALGLRLELKVVLRFVIGTGAVAELRWS